MPSRVPRTQFVFSSVRDRSQRRTRSERRIPHAPSSVSYYVTQPPTAYPNPRAFAQLARRARSTLHRLIRPHSLPPLWTTRPTFLPCRPRHPSYRANMKLSTVTRAPPLACFCHPYAPCSRTSASLRSAAQCEPVAPLRLEGSSWRGARSPRPPNDRSVSARARERRCHAFDTPLCCLSADSDMATARGIVSVPQIKTTQQRGNSRHKHILRATHVLSSIAASRWRKEICPAAEHDTGKHAGGLAF
ncbi:hypothetical protein A0H81_10337 [Grifola frondosa]|uniref:Uncharacterized protein n=1 Tax=Grifola frondosa TaxID=5627 RepID=A0A1C7M021_GRIFR|nr:hypothetical protein A0H81_10337 [Grifola frondosa]